MAEIVNLRKARKAQVRAANAKDADTRRLQFGRTKGERLRDETAARRAERLVEGTKLTRTEVEGSDSDSPD